MGIWCKMSDSLFEAIEANISLRGSRPKLLPAEKIRSIFRKYATSASSCLDINAMSTHLSKRNSFFTCKTALEKLQRVTMSQLPSNMSATGKYVLVRCLENGSCGARWHTVVEDEAGDACLLSVFHYPPRELFSPGTALIVKEPYLMTTFFQNNSRCMYSICCDSITDILVLTPSHHLFYLTENIRWINKLEGNAIDPLRIHPPPSNASEWKERGDTLLAQNQLISAREAYFLGLAMCEDEEAEELLKLSLLKVYTALEYYEEAIDLGEEIEEVFEDGKALWRLGKAYYEVGNFAKAFLTYVKALKTFPKSALAIVAIRSVLQRIKERDGLFAIEELRQLSDVKPLDAIDCADYYGPTEIQYICGKRGKLILTKDVGKNTLLFVSKALASVLRPEQTSNETADVGIIFLKLVTMINKNPKTFGPPVFSLFAGPTSSGEPLRLFCDPKFQREPICDVGKLKAICEHNCFQIVNVSSGKVIGVGLFVRPSYLSHSDRPNVVCEFYNDVMVVTAKTNLKAGTELSINYADCREKRFGDLKRKELASEWENESLKKTKYS